MPLHLFQNVIQLPTELISKDLAILAFGCQVGMTEDQEKRQRMRVMVLVLIWQQWQKMKHYHFL